MRYLFIVLMLTANCHALFAQNIDPQMGKPRAMPNFDSIYSTIRGTTYVPYDFTTLDGKRFTNESSAGKVTFINYWFEGCGPCRNEFGMLNKLYDSVKNNPSFQFVAVTFDPANSLSDFIRHFNIRYPVATVLYEWESKRLNYQLGFPTSVIIDKEGKVAYIGMKGITEGDNGPFAISLQNILSIMRKQL